MVEPTVALRGVAKSFHGEPVLAGIDLVVPPGELVVVIGPSGAGKTTLLRIIAALTAWESGEVQRFGERVDPSAVWPNDARLGFVFQEGRLFPHLSLRDNCLLAPRYVRKLPRREAEAEVDELLAELGIAEHGGYFPHQVSGGQRQRAALARSLSGRPELLLLDEMTASLDPENVATLLELLRRIVRERKLTCLCNTHHLGFAERAAHRLIFLDGGRIRADGPPGAILRESADPRVRSFVDALRRTEAPGG